MISKVRYEEMRWSFWNETNDPETEEWREDLTDEEKAIVASWDEGFFTEYERLLRAVAELANKNGPTGEGSTRGAGHGDTP